MEGIIATFFAIVMASVFTQNFITSKTYGICPFLGVSKKTTSALGMGVAVTLVMVIATAVTYPVYEYVMVPLGIEFLEIIFFILLSFFKKKVRVTAFFVPLSFTSKESGGSVHRQLLSNLRERMDERC